MGTVHKRLGVIFLVALDENELVRSNEYRHRQIQKSSKFKHST